MIQSTKSHWRFLALYQDFQNAGAGPQSVIIFLIHCCWESLKGVHSVANSADPDQMPHNAASDQGLHCLLTAIFV